MSGGGDAQRSRATSFAVVAGIGIVVVAGLLLAAFQLGRVVERDDRRDAGSDFAYPLLLDDLRSHALDAEDRLYGDRYVPHPAVPEVVEDPAQQFSVWREQADGTRVQRIFSEDGEVVELAGGLFDARADDFRRWHLSSRQRDEITDRIHTSSLPDEAIGTIGSFGDRSVSLTISVGGQVRVVEVDADGPPSPLPFDPAADVARLIDDLFDLSWLDPTIEAADEPWTPLAVTVWVAPEQVDPQAADAEPWPLDGPVLEATDGVDQGPDAVDQPYRCLAGDDAAAVFALLRPDRGQSVVVDDGGELRRVTLRFSFPFHVVRNDRCS